MLEVAPLDSKKKCMFENPGNLETVEEGKKKGDDRGRKPSRKGTSPTNPVSSTKTGGKEQPGKSKGNRKKHDS